MRKTTQPLHRLLELGDGPRVGEIATVEKDVAIGNVKGTRVGVADADEAGPLVGGGWRESGWIVFEVDDGGGGAEGFGFGDERGW